MINSRVFRIALIALCFSCNSATAEMIKYNIYGSVISLDTTLQGGPINVGDVVVGSFFANTVAKSTNTDGTFSSYDTSDLKLSIGNGYNLISSKGYIWVFNDYYSIPDRIQIDFTSGIGLTGPTIKNVWTPDYLHGQYYGDFSSSELPKSIDVNRPRNSGFALRFNVNDNVQIRFKLTHLSVLPISPPEPPSDGVCLVGPVILLLGQ